MTGIPEAAMAVLEKLTDPTEIALSDAVTAVEELYGQIVSLEKAIDDEGDDIQAYLSSLAYDASSALERLTELMEEKRG